MFFPLSGKESHCGHAIWQVFVLYGCKGMDERMKNRHKLRSSTTEARMDGSEFQSRRD